MKKSSYGTIWKWTLLSHSVCRKILWLSKDKNEFRKGGLQLQSKARTTKSWARDPIYKILFVPLTGNEWTLLVKALCLDHFWAFRKIKRHPGFYKGLDMESQFSEQNSSMQLKGATSHLFWEPCRQNILSAWPHFRATSPKSSINIKLYPVTRNTAHCH